MSRWIARVIGIVLLVVFIVLMVHLQRKLEIMQQNRQTTTSTSR